MWAAHGCIGQASLYSSTHHPQRKTPKTKTVSDQQLFASFPWRDAARCHARTICPQAAEGEGIGAQQTEGEPPNAWT
eukprot:355871-Chlamydomonas_euryale.AAC.10